MLTETGYEIKKSHDLLSLWGVDGGRGLCKFGKVRGRSGGGAGGGGGGLSKPNKCKQGGMGVPNFGHFVIT